MVLSLFPCLHQSGTAMEEGSSNSIIVGVGDLADLADASAESLKLLKIGGSILEGVGTSASWISRAVEIYKWQSGQQSLGRTALSIAMSLHPYAGIPWYSFNKYWEIHRFTNELRDAKRRATESEMELQNSCKVLRDAMIKSNDYTKIKAYNNLCNTP